MFLILLLSRTHFCVLLYIILYWWLGLVWGNSNLCVKNKKYTIKFKEQVVRYAKNILWTKQQRNLESIEKACISRRKKKIA